MQTFLLIGLLILDAALLFLVLRLNRRQTEQSQILDDLTEERKILEDMRKSVEDDLTIHRATSHELMERMTKLAMEAEQELKTGASSLEDETKKLIAKAELILAEPTKTLTALELRIQKILQRVETEKKSLLRMLSRGEEICRFFNGKVPYEDILSEIEDKKYQDARRLLASGVSVEKISEELHLPLPEVRILASMR